MSKHALGTLCGSFAVLFGARGDCGAGTAMAQSTGAHSVDVAVESFGEEAIDDVSAGRRNRRETGQGKWDLLGAEHFGSDGVETGKGVGDTIQHTGDVHNPRPEIMPMGEQTQALDEPLQIESFEAGALFADAITGGHIVAFEEHSLAVPIRRIELCGGNHSEHLKEGNVGLRAVLVIEHDCVDPHSSKTRRGSSACRDISADAALSRGIGEHEHIKGIVRIGAAEQPIKGNQITVRIVDNRSNVAQIGGHFTGQTQALIEIIREGGDIFYATHPRREVRKDQLSRSDLTDDGAHRTLADGEVMATRIKSVVDAMNVSVEARRGDAEATVYGATRHRAIDTVEDIADKGDLRGGRVTFGFFGGDLNVLPGLEHLSKLSYGFCVVRMAAEEIYRESARVCQRRHSQRGDLG